MARTLPVLLLAALTGLLPLNTSRAAESPTAEQARRAAEVRKKLATPADFSGVQDPEAKLDDVLSYMTRIWGVRFEVNEQAFKDEMIDDILAKPIGREVPKLAKVSAESVLRRVLARIPAASGTTFVVRDGAVEITTRRYASPSLWGAGSGEGATPPEVSIEFNQRPLREALQEIADATGVNILLDTGAGDKGAEPVTATMHGVGVDTVIQLLASMADLTSMPVENVLYVTTKQRAKALRADLLKLETENGEGQPPANAVSAPAPADSERLLKERDDEIRRLKAKLKRNQKAEPAPKKDQ
jgi:hypothetical protein